MEQFLVLALVGVELLHVFLKSIKDAKLDVFFERKVFEVSVLQVKVALFRNKKISLGEILLV